MFRLLPHALLAFLLVMPFSRAGSVSPARSALPLPAVVAIAPAPEGPVEYLGDISFPGNFLGNTRNQRISKRGATLNIGAAGNPERLSISVGGTQLIGTITIARSINKVSSARISLTDMNYRIDDDTVVRQSFPGSPSTFPVTISVKSTRRGKRISISNLRVGFLFTAPA